MSCGKLAFGHLDLCVGILAGMFNKYASKEGDPTTLTKKEVKELIKNEMPETLGKVPDEELNKILSDLDLDDDGVMNFLEYVILIGTVAAKCSLMQLEEQSKHQMPAL